MRVKFQMRLKYNFNLIWNLTTPIFNIFIKGLFKAHLNIKADD